MIKKLEQNPNDWKVLQSLAKFYTEEEEFDRGIECWKLVAQILGDKFGMKRVQGNRRDFAWAYIGKARHLTNKIQQKIINGEKIDADSQEILEIKELYDKASELYTDTYENPPDYLRNRKDDISAGRSTMIMVDGVPKYQVIISDLKKLELLASYEDYNSASINPEGRIPVKSSNIKSIGYDSKSKVLEVEFHGFSIYRYFEVPENIYHEFMAASSKGKYLMAKIRDRYRYEKII